MESRESDESDAELAGTVNSDSSWRPSDSGLSAGEEDIQEIQARITASEQEGEGMRKQTKRTKKKPSEKKEGDMFAYKKQY